MTNNVKCLKFVFYICLSFAFVKNLNFVEGVNNAIKPIYSPNPKIPFISFCCKKGMLYDPLQDNCADNIITDHSHHMTNNTQLGGKIVTFTGVFPYNEKKEYMDFYNFDNDSMSQYKRQFYVNSTGLVHCPEGFISRSSKYFGLFDNGFARTREGFLKASEYCLNEIEIEEEEEEEKRGEGEEGKREEEEEISTSVNYVVRFCIPDPCTNGTGCIRKCCPTGFSLMEDPDKYECKPHPVDLNISSLRSEDGMPIKFGPFIINVNYQNIPECDEWHGEITIELKEFSIIPDGRMKYRGKKPTDQYCVDNEFNNYSDTVVSIKNISYFQSPFS